MNHRRPRLACSLFVAVLAAALDLQAGSPSSSADSLAALRSGNAVFAATPGEPWAVDGFRGRHAADRPPLAAVLSCADAGVPPEIVFRAGPGDLFVIRTAGPVADVAAVAAIEYAVARLHAPLLVVMGHESCGIVQSFLGDAAADLAGTHLESVRKKWRPAASGLTTPADARRLRIAILETVEDQINELLEGSATVRREAEQQTLTLVGAYFEQATGLVHFSQPVTVMAGDSARQPH